MRSLFVRSVRGAVLLAAFGVMAVLASARPAQAMDRLCDPSFEDCRAILINYIRNETVGIDVGFWFMEDARYSAELVKKFQAGVPVRVIMDVRANDSYPLNAQRLAELQSGGIPMRKRTASGIMHYKLMLFAGQGVVEFSGANFSADAWLPVTPYVNYIDEACYFTDNQSFVNSFKKKFDDLWTTSTGYANYANVTTLARAYPDLTSFPKDPQLNFPPAESYASRAVSAYNKETGPGSKIDVIMYRITQRKHTDAMIAAVQRGVAVRLMTEPAQYRDPTRLWDAWNVDRLYMAGVQIKMRAHQGLNHQKLVLLYKQRMSIFGSSNWTSPSDDSQEEHNCFCTDSATFDWFVNMFERKWNNTNPVEYADFAPLPPDRPANQSPANAAANLSTASVTLKWYGGPWAHRYDVYVGLDPNNLQPVMTDQELGPSETATQYQSFTLSNLQPGTTYYWRVVSRTMANLTKTGDIWSFTTSGNAAPPPVTGPTGAGDIVIYGTDGFVTGAAWKAVSDATAAGGGRVWNPNANSAKITAALASPTSYVEYTFNAVAGQPYHMWLRLRAENDTYANDSLFAQFSGAVNASGTPVYRIGTTAAAEFNLEDCADCGVSSWGWQDNGYGRNVFGPNIYFAASGPQTIRFQQREDGVSVDQIVLSPGMYLSRSPGALKQDTTILPRVDGTGGGTTPPPPPASAALPTGWQHADIGAVGVMGNAAYDGTTGTFTVSGGGADVWGTADAFHYAYTTLTGDGSITARVASVSSTAAWVKAGVMIRNGVAANAAHGFMLESYSKGLAFQRRPSDGGSSLSTAGALAPAPYWVRLVRSGNMVTAFQSADGANWVQVGSETLTLGNVANIGFAVSSHTTSANATATFDNVQFTGTVGAGSSAPPPPPQTLLPDGWLNQDIGAVGAAGASTYDAGTGVFTVKGAGADVWGTADAFQFAYTSLTGDGSVTARVLTTSNTASWVKAGVMVRNSLSPSAAQGFMLVSYSKGLAFQRRTVDGGLSTSTAGVLAAAPYWVRIERVGDIVTAYQSADGETWTAVDSDTIPMGTTVYVGLGVSSHVTSKTATATFDNVSVVQGTSSEG